MQIILVRHGEAYPQAFDQTDGQRELTERGHQQAHWTAEQVLTCYQPDRIFVSPYVRAQQTLAEFFKVQPALKQLSCHVLAEIVPDGNAEAAIKTLAGFKGDCFLVVCHMNTVAYVAALLEGLDPESFALAEARVLEQPVIAAGLATSIKRFVPSL